MLEQEPEAKKEMSWIIDSFVKLKNFISSSLKYGSVAIVVIIPLAIALNGLGYVREQVIIWITEIVIWFSVAEVLFNALMKKYKKEKLELAKIRLQIKLENIEGINALIAVYSKGETPLSEALVDQATTLVQNISAKGHIDSEIQEQATDLIQNLQKQEPIQETEFTR